MKTKTVNVFLLMCALLIITSCHKTYTCKCTDPSGNSTYTTGQVKAMSKNSAEKKCSGSCSGGTISVK